MAKKQVTAYTFMLTKDIEVCMTEDGVLLSAMDYRPAFDCWRDCELDVRNDAALMHKMDEKLADEKAMHGE